MELPTAVKLLLLGQAICLATAGVPTRPEQSTTTNDTKILTVAYNVSDPSPPLFEVGGDRVHMFVRGCFKHNDIVCCYNKPMDDSLVQGARICSQFGPANCCALLPEPDRDPRVPGDMVSLVPTLSAGQCEQRRRGGRVLHCCHGRRPQDENSTICHAVRDMTCCYSPFAGVEFAFRLRSSNDNTGLGLVIVGKNREEE